jgi:DNA-binding beta-propeller fold protein YncE
MSISFVFYFILALGLLLTLSGNISRTLSSPSSLSNYIFDRNIPQDGIGEIKIHQPEGIELDSQGNLYVNDIEPNSIKKFSKNGSYLLSWGSTGSGNGQFNHPHGNEIDIDGNVYITDQNNARVQKFNSDGKFITKWGTHGTGDGEFLHPHGIAVDSKGYVFV